MDLTTLRSTREWQEIYDYHIDSGLSEQEARLKADQDMAQALA